MTGPWLLWVLVGLNAILVLPREIAAIDRWWRRRQQRKYDEAVDRLINGMGEICPPLLFPQVRQAVLDNAYGERLFTEDQLDEVRAEIEEINARSLDKLQKEIKSYRQKERDDWRASESALAWGVVYRGTIQIAPANGFHIMDTTEWWMLHGIEAADRQKERDEAP